MSNALETSAVQEALKGNWVQAIELNKQIINDSPLNIAALNRLAKAYKEIGDIKKCTASYRKVLQIDKYNTIAIKNLKRLTQSIKSSKNPLQIHNGMHPNENSNYLFLEEPGKTKIIFLVNLAPASVLSNISPSDEVTLSPKRHTIQVTDMNNIYLGALPDDLARRLTTLIKGGNRYSAFVKSVGKKELAVLIREIHKCSRFKNQPSFLPIKLSDIKSGGKEIKQYPEPDEQEESKPEEEEANF